MAGKKKVTQIPETELLPEIGSLDYWREQARHIAPEETDDWRISEIATALSDFARLLGGHWQSINAVCENNDDRTVELKLVTTINRSENPTRLKMKITFVQKVEEEVSGDVPDPSQVELPLETSSEVEQPHIVQAAV